MRDRLLEDLKQSMKDKNKERLAVIRMIKGAMQLEELNLKKELNDDEMIGLISKQIKTRKESIAEFEKAGRVDLVDQTNREIDILNEYMPEQMSEEEVLEVIDKVWNTVNPTSMKDMGKVMGIVTPKVKGRYDMNEISSMVRSKLG